MKTVSMKPVVQNPRKDGFWAVYIRFTFDGQCQFWKTTKVVSSQNVKSKSEITDPYVLSFCSSLILQWTEKLNHVNYSMWSLKDIVEYVTVSESQVSFSNYARTYIERIDKPRTAKNYTLALKHLERYMGTCELMFQSLTENSLNEWINTMVRDGKKRAKEMYPVCIRHLWRNAMKELNVPEQGIVRIKYNPWERITIPQSDETVKQAKSPNAMRTFFSCPIPTKPFAIEMLFVDDIHLVTKIKKNMKNSLMNLYDKILLRKRALVETVNDELKNVCHIEHTRHRSVDNFAVNLLAALIAYNMLPKKPEMNIEIIDKSKLIA